MPVYLAMRQRCVFLLDGLVILKNDEFVFYRFLLGQFVDGL